MALEFFSVGVILKRNEKVLFIGGDRRSIAAISELKANECDVSSYGIFDNSKKNIDYYDVIVLPVPTTRNGETVFCPLTDCKIFLDEIKAKAGDRLVISCGYNNGFINCVDLLKLDSYAYLNAIPTAEGAIAFCINNTDFTLWKSKVLIIGNGRVGKVLASRLAALGADLTVSARKDSDFAFLDTQGIKHIHTYDIIRKISGFDVVFNTVDADVFDDVSPFKEKILIDLSTKGCIKNHENTGGCKIYKLPGLPGKTAPETAGKIIGQTVMQLMSKQRR